MEKWGRNEPRMNELLFDSVSYRYPGARSDAVNSLTLRVSSGSKLALIGRNGSGKSTLMLLANGTLKPTDGAVQLDGTPVRYDRRGLNTLRERVGIVFQNPEDQLFSATVFQDLSAGPLNLGLSESETRTRVEEVAERCDLIKLLDRPTHALSGGEKTRVALAGMLAMCPTFLFADEITNELDPWLRVELLHILDRFVDRGMGVVLSTHDWELAETWADEIAYLVDGRIAAHGSPSDVFQNIQAPERYQRIHE